MQIQRDVECPRIGSIRLIGSKTGAQIKSLVSREELRKECEGKVNELLVRETGKKAVRELIFTKYLYQ